MQWKKFSRLKATATGQHSRARRMLCCGRRKENGRSVPDVTASPGRAPPGPIPVNQMHHQTAAIANQHNRQIMKEPVLQGDFRKVSGISSEIFRQIEAVENDHDPNTAAALEAVERRGDMIVRILEPRSIGGKQAVEAAHRLLSKGDARHTVQLVEIVKRPGQTLGLYIREGNGQDRSDGVFISRIALESAVYNSGCLNVGDEILAVNLVDVTHMSLDDVVIIMSIPRRLVLAIRQRRGGRGTSSPAPTTLSRPEQKPPPVVVIKRDLREDEMDDPERIPRSRSSRERRTGDGREMTESRSRLGLGLNNYSPQSEQLDLYYNNRPNALNDPPSWGYKPPPPPPPVITEQPKPHTFAPSHSYYQNAGTLESLAEKVHSFYPGTTRRMSAGTAGVGFGQQQHHMRFPRSGSDQHLPRVEYADFSTLNRNSFLRSNLKGQMNVGGTLGRYGRMEPQRMAPKFGPQPLAGTGSLSRRSRPNLDYSSDSEATMNARPSYYYYNRPAIGTLPRGTTTNIINMGVGATPADLNKFNSLPRDRPGARLGGIRRITDRLLDDADGNLSAPEYASAKRDLRSRIQAAPNPATFSSDEYRAWLRRAPSSSAIAEQMRISRDFLAQPRNHRFSCSAENIHDALKNTESIYSSRTHMMTGTLDRHALPMHRPMTALPVRSMSSQHIGGPGSIRSPSIRRMRQLLELSAGSGLASPSGSIMSTGGHQSPAPTPSTTLPRAQKQIEINPAEFVKYKLDKPVVDPIGISGMLWIHLLAGRGLRAHAEPVSGNPPPPGMPVQTNPMSRDLYCVLECDRVHKARTVVRSGDIQFDWDESFELDLMSNKQLDVLVYSWDPQHRHKLCYRGAISLSALLRQSPLHQLAVKVEPRGTIYIRLRHTDATSLYKRRGLPSLRGSYPQLFGADLETVVNREAKTNPGNAPVPIVLRRCVEEIERRGLDIIGLYRLCGSATKKRLLREAFERNSRAVELTPEHVPDINVITGVLKDYLRELPEPLFTRCLFQMTVDALAVCLPDDPDGNAKLMLSILDCLPRANRATLVFLLDHLSLVVSSCERNKMSAQALATVMGPPLMLHSASVNPGAEIDHAQPIAVLKYLLQIWPHPQKTGAVSSGGIPHGTAAGAPAPNTAPQVNIPPGRRGDLIGQRGNRANASPADKLLLQQTQIQLGLLPNRLSTSAINIHSQGQPHPSATAITANSRPYQSVVAQLAQSPRVSPQAGKQAISQRQQLGGLAVSATQDPLQQPLPETPSPGSSSVSTGSGSGSGTDTIKRGASPDSVRHIKIQESPSIHTTKKQINIEVSVIPTSPTITSTSASPTPKASSTGDKNLLSTSSSGATKKDSSSDDSDEFLSYKNKPATNALLAESQALTTTQLLSKYLKREPMCTITTIKSPTVETPPTTFSRSNMKISTAISSSTVTCTTTSNNESSSSTSTTPSSASSVILKSILSEASATTATSATTPTATTMQRQISTRPKGLVSSKCIEQDDDDSDEFLTSASSSAAYESNKHKQHSASALAATASSSSSSSAVFSKNSNMVSPDYSLSGNGNSNSSNNLSGRGNINSNISSNFNISSTTTITTSGGLSSNNAMNIYGTLPKQHSSLPSASSSGIYTSSDITSTDHITSSYYKEFNTADGGNNSNSSSGVSSMAGSTSSYDFYTQQRSRPGHNYNTIGTYKVQYSSTNPFFDAIEPQQMHYAQGSPYNFGSNGDDYDDLK